MDCYRHVEMQGGNDYFWLPYSNLELQGAENKHTPVGGTAPIAIKEIPYSLIFMHQ